MINIVVTPEIIRRLEDNMEYVIVSTWGLRERASWWRRVVKTRAQTTKRELVQWLVEQAGIEDIGDGGSLTYDDMVEHMQEIVARKFGKGLRLTDDEIEDGSAFDRGGAWARGIAKNGALHPQRQAAALLRGGKTIKGYDNVSFWNTAHPVRPGGGGGVYPNIHYNMPFSPENVTKAYSIIENIKAPDGEAMGLIPSLIMGGTIERVNITSALEADFFSDRVNTGGQGASATNIIKTKYGFQEPIIHSDFNEVVDVGAGVMRGVWYMVCDVEGEDDRFGPIVYSERKAFSLNTYTPVDDVTLGQMDAFEYQFKGRNATTPGHPFAIHRFEPGPA